MIAATKLCMMSLFWCLWCLSFPHCKNCQLRIVIHKQLKTSHILTLCRSFSPSIQPPVCTGPPCSALSSPTGLSAARCWTPAPRPFLATSCCLRDTWKINKQRKQCNLLLSAAVGGMLKCWCRIWRHLILHGQLLNSIVFTSCAVSKPGKQTQNTTQQQGSARWCVCLYIHVMADHFLRQVSRWF